MVELRSFVVNLPSFIERSYFISPGIVSVIFKVIWTIFTFLVVTVLIQYGFAALGLNESKTTQQQKSLWKIHGNYCQVQSVSNGRLGGMVYRLLSKRVILGFLFWISIYACEYLFSLSIDNTYITYYNGTNCIGRVDNITTMIDTMWYLDPMTNPVTPPKNITLLRQLVNQKQIGNIALLGDGIFTIAPTNGLYKQNQTISVSRTGYNCNSSASLLRASAGILYTDRVNSEVGYNISTPHFSNITSAKIGNIDEAYVTLRIIDQKYIDMGEVNYTQVSLLLVANPYISTDINVQLYNGSVFLNECTFFYEHGVVTIAEDGYLNQSNIGESYTKVADKIIDTGYWDSRDTFGFSRENTYTLSLFDYPDIFFSPRYNEPYLKTLQTVNEIMAAHIINGLDPYADLCTYNQEQVPIYLSVLGTRMSFGYAVVGVAFTVLVLLILAIITFTMFTPEERKQWLLYSIDFRFTGYVYTSENLDQKAFKKFAKDAYITDNDSKETLLKDETI